MIITRLEGTEGSKIRVYIDEDFAFLLNEKELERYRLKEGIDLSVAEYERILEETIYHKVLDKALYILKFADRSENELRRKLSQAEFPDVLIDRAISYVKEYGYLDDKRFASSFIRVRMNKKSKLMIKNELLQKGISGEILEEAFNEAYEEEEEDAELSAIKKAIAKKTADPEALTYEEKQKLIASLYRKGFDLGKIKQCL
jgi:regulatory protein